MRKLDVSPHLHSEGVVEADEVASEKGASEGVDDDEERLSFVFRRFVDSFERVVQADELHQGKRRASGDDAQSHVNVDADEIVSLFSIGEGSLFS